MTNLLLLAIHEPAAQYLFQRRIVLIAVLLEQGQDVVLDNAGEPGPVGHWTTINQQVGVSDLQVTVTHVGGKVETFGDEIVRLELILDATGRVDQVHIIARSGTEADTHIWYNVNNLVALRYRFLEITGKSKVVVRAFAPPELARPEQSVRKKVVPLDPEDYR